MKLSINTESAEQQALFDWAELMKARCPELALLYHIPNGGQRAAATATRLKAEGVKPGVPDVCLPVAKGAYHGLYLEMKVGKNKPTPHQRWWLEQLKKQNYFTAVAYNFTEAAAIITQYLKLKDG